MSLPSRRKRGVIWVLIAFLIILGLLIMVLELVYLPRRIEVIVWFFIVTIVLGGLGLVSALLEDLVGQKRLGRYVMIFLPPAVISFFIIGFSFSSEGKPSLWEAFVLYFILCLAFWYAGASFHNFIIEEGIARCPKCKAQLLCYGCDKETIVWLDNRAKEKDNK